MESRDITPGLLLAMPGGQVPNRERLNVIPGTVPDLAARPSGCSFRERCSRARDICAELDPKLEVLGSGRTVACHNPVPEGQGHA